MAKASLHPDLILTNARVITLNEGQPAAEAVAVQGDRIAWVGSNNGLADKGWNKDTVIDCEGKTLVPGLIDAHCHVFAYASSLIAVDCSPSAVESIADIKDALQKRAMRTPPGEWIRATGYSEFDLADKRHPTRWDLDEAVPHSPIRLNHRSGHACVLNSIALASVGITTNTEEPAGGTIERDLETGEPTGLLLEMDEYLQSRVPPLSREELRQGMIIANQRFVSCGITSVQDASPTNCVQRWEDFKRLKDANALAPRVMMMSGADCFPEFSRLGLGYGSGDFHLNLGHVKIMLHTTGGHLIPSQDELESIVSSAHEFGFPVAMHAVEAEAVASAADVLMRVGSASIAKKRDRVEHCSECPPHVLEKLARCGVVVVTQPSFIYHSGRRYLSEVEEEMQPWLYRTKSFLEADLRPAASSDAPVTEPDPFIGMYAAVTRRTSSGEVIGDQEMVSPDQALKMLTLNGAYAASQEKDKGSIEPGKLADFALLSDDPSRVEADKLREIKSLMTIVGGKVVWQA